MKIQLLFVYDELCNFNNNKTTKKKLSLILIRHKVKKKYLNTLQST